MSHQINDLLVRLAQALNTGDATAYAELFTDDADYITFFGMHMEGREAIESSHRHLFEGPLKGSTMSVGQDGQVKIRHLSHDVALVVSGGGSTLDGQKPDPGRDSIVSFTAVRQADGWLFASFQNTRRSQL